MADPIVTLDGILLEGVDEHGVRWKIPKNGLTGWYGSPAPVLSTGKRTRAHGVWAGDSWLDARTVAIEGVLKAPSHEAAEDALARLTAACALHDVPLVVQDSRSLSAMARRADEVLPLWLNRETAQWSIQLLAEDPRKLGETLTASTGLPSTSGGLAVGVGETLGTIPFLIAADVVSGQVSLVNPGNIDGPVTLRIDGPVTGPRVTHVNSGRSLVFASSLALGEGEYLIVDMQRREVLAQGQASRNGWVTERGWSAFQRGVNVWAFSASGGGATGTLTVTATEAWM